MVKVHFEPITKQYILNVQAQQDNKLKSSKVAVYFVFHMLSKRPCNLHCHDDSFYKTGGVLWCASKY